MVEVPPSAGAVRRAIDGPVIGGVDVTAVPEPAAWALMLLGFAAVGFGARMRRPSVRAGAANA